MGNKTGRKGDPRMHRAVQAKLLNPSLSLFEALREGGFDYAVDDDAQAWDSEQITLGQRKNQLSRRLRLAKRIDNNGELPPSHGMMGSDNGSIGRGSVGSSAMGVVGSDRHHHRHAKPATNGGRGKKRSSTNASGSGDGNNNALLDDLDEADFRTTMDEAPSRIVKAKNHPDYRGPIIVLPRSGLRQQQQQQQQQLQQQNQANGSSGNVSANLTGTRSALDDIAASSSTQSRAILEQQEMLLAGLNNSQLQQQQQQQILLGQQFYNNPLSQLVGAPPPSALNPYASLLGLHPSSLNSTPQALGGGGGTRIATTSPKTSVGVGPAGVLSSTSVGSAHHLPSGVAVASLNSTAQRIGMTLEQLALSLSMCSNLSKVLSVMSADGHDSDDRHGILAQNLCLEEMRGLYTRSMLLAGFPMEQADEDSTKYLEIAASVWQAEGKRLGSLLRAKNLTGLVAKGTDGTMNPSELLFRTRKRSGARHPPEDYDSDHADDDDDGDDDDSNDDEEEEHDQKQVATACASRSYRDEQGTHRGSNHHNHLHSNSSKGGHHHNHNHGGPSEDTRHVHRLEGCGHRAILHQPENGPAHIDFMVGDKIECFQGLTAAAAAGAPSSSESTPHQLQNTNTNNTSSLNAWLLQPSDTHSHGAPPSEDGSSVLAMGSNTNLPRMLDISDLDLDGKEWVTDETLLSLFKLSDPSPPTEENNKP